MFTDRLIRAILQIMGFREQLRMSSAASRKWVVGWLCPMICCVLLLTSRRLIQALTRLFSLSSAGSTTAFCYRQGQDWVRIRMKVRVTSLYAR